MDALAVVPSPSADFDFETTPSLPSTPARFGDYLYFSTPASPSRVSLPYHHFDAFMSSSVDFEDGRDFAFDYRAGREEELLSAEELFDCGMIRPLKLPPCLQPPRSLRPDSSSTKKRKESQDWCGEGAGRERGRERVVSSSPSRRTARSHSPLRVSAYPWEEDNRGQQDSAALTGPIDFLNRSTFSSSNPVWGGPGSDRGGRLRSGAGVGRLKSGARGRRPSWEDTSARGRRPGERGGRRGRTRTEGEDADERGCRRGGSGLWERTGGGGRGRRGRTGGGPSGEKRFEWGREKVRFGKKIDVRVFSDLGICGPN